MKKLIVGAVVFCFFHAALPSFGDFNIFTSRRVVIGDITSSSGKEYEYIADSVRSSLYITFLQIPFLTLTDEERSLLRQLAMEPRYEEEFLDAGETIPYRVTPVVEKGTYTDEHWPLYLSGSYTVLPDDRVQLSLSAYNTLIDKTVASYSESISLESLLQNPQSYQVPFLRSFLKYRTYRVSIEADPQDSFIFIDGEAVGIGKVEELLLPAGRYRLSITRDGYEQYSDLFTLSEEDIRITVVLDKKKSVGELSLSTVPQSADVLVDERYVGRTPLLIQIPSERSILTVKKEGYSEETLRASDLLSIEKGGSFELRLLPIYEAEQLLVQADRLKRQARLLSYTGIGMVGLSILLGAQKTLSEQRADLYRESNQERYEQARSSANLLSALTSISAAATTGFFIFSFSKMVKYFTLYNRAPAVTFLSEGTERLESRK
jgi:hypothetical protein